MVDIFKHQKEFIISPTNKARIDAELEKLSTLSDGIYAKIKEFPLGYYVKIIIEKNKIGIQLDNTDKIIPECITFLMIIDYSFPNDPPKILSKTKFSFPNLMDGRNLSNEIVPNWSPKDNLYDTALLLPKFVKKIMSSPSLGFYGFFSVGAVYNLNNFNNMMVNTFQCRIDHSYDTDPLKVDYNTEGDLTLVLSDDCLVLFQNFEKDPSIGKVIFWATLFSITDLQINKSKKLVKLTFYSDNKSKDEVLRLTMINLLFFRDALVKKMLNLQVKIEKNKIIKGGFEEKRYSLRDISNMTIDQIEFHRKEFHKKIEENELSYYIINTYSILCSKAIEFYSLNEEEGDKHTEVLLEMQTVLKKPEVQEIVNKDFIG